MAFIDCGGDRRLGAFQYFPDLIHWFCSLSFLEKFSKKK